jgi:UDPglucose 6-dehydrogenase
LADAGNHVICVDVDEDKVQALNEGRIPIYEPGLDNIVTRNIGAGRLTFTMDIPEAVRSSLFQFIAVGTPSDENGAADMQYVLEVARAVAESMDDYKVLVTKSTVPVGTASKVRSEVEAVLERRGMDTEFDVVSNPEFLKEGAAVSDFMKPDRIVVGTDSPRAERLLHELYEPFNRNHDRLICMDVQSAELTKYAANAMLATKISFMNELANMAEVFGADIEMVRIGIGSDPRIGYEFIYPGCGYGGSCFPKDVRALANAAGRAQYEAELIQAVENVNNRQKHVLFKKIMQHFGNAIHGKTLALWGLAFKPNTDDMREAPSRALMEACWAEGASIRAYDPEAGAEARRIYPDRSDLELCESAEEALVDADALVIVTEWNEFRSPDFVAIRERLTDPVIFDGRNLYDPVAVRRHGISYYGIGRGGPD